MMADRSPKPPKHSETTSSTSPSEDRVLEGLDISICGNKFKAKGRSDAKVRMMKKLVGIGIGFRDLEELNEDLNLRLTSETLKNRIKDGHYNQKKFVEIVMNTILLDETLVNKELEKLVELERRKIKEETGENSKMTRTKLRKLNMLAREERREKTKIYNNKIRNLQRKYKKDEEQKLDRVPEEIRDFEHARVFSRKGFEEIDGAEVQVIVVGEIELSEEEREVLQKHPKYAILEHLDIKEIEVDIELGQSKWRYSMMSRLREEKEQREKAKREDTGIGEGQEDQ